MAWEMCLRKKKKKMSLGLSNPTKNPTGPESTVARSDYCNVWRIGCESPPPKFKKPEPTGCTSHTWQDLLDLVRS